MHCLGASNCDSTAAAAAAADVGGGNGGNGGNSGNGGSDTAECSTAVAVEGGQTRDEGVVLDDAVESECVLSGAAGAVGVDGGAVTGRGEPSTLWDEDQQWILVFDRLLNGSAKCTKGGRQEQTDGSSAELQSPATRSNLSRSGSLRFSGRRPPRPLPSLASSSSSSPSAAAAAAAAGPSSSTAGAVDEAMFIAAFENVPRISVMCQRDVDELLATIRPPLTDPAANWDQRVESLKRLRSLLMCGGSCYQELVQQQLRLLLPSLQLAVQDLRSQVVREACITVAYIAQQLGLKADSFCLAMTPILLDLVANSAKVIASSGLVAIRFIIQHCPYWRLIAPIAAPLTTSLASSRSRDIRRASCELLEQLLTTWPAASLHKQLPQLQEAVKRGINDADSDVRATSRRAYWSFASNFAEQADSLLSSLDNGHKKLLTNGTHSVDSAPGVARNSCSATLSRSGSIRRRQNAIEGAPATPFRRPAVGAVGGSASARSTSAVDLQAAQRARARALYAAAQRNGAASHERSPMTSPMTNSTHMAPTTSSAVTSPSTPSQVPITPLRGRPSQSQPGSRSSSPSRRLFAGYRRPSANTARVSNPPSRDSSPPSTPTSSRVLPGAGSRWKSQSPFVRGSATSSSLRSPARPNYFSSSSHQHKQVSRLTACMSGLSVGNGADLAHLPPGRLTSEPSTEDVCAMIAAVSSDQWTERKRGLVSLHGYLLSDRSLSGSQLQQVTQVFNVLFVDAHTKVFGLFLDTLQELLVQHHADLAHWQSTLTCRLLNKLGADLLGSVVHKLNKTLELVRCLFCRRQQLESVCRWLLDRVQVHSARVRVASLQHLRLLLEAMEPPEFTVTTQLQHTVAKVIGWSSEPRSADIRREAQAVIVALFDLNTPQFTIMLSSLTKDHQDTATSIMRRHLSQRSCGANATLTAAAAAGGGGGEGGGGVGGTPDSVARQASTCSVESDDRASQHSGAGGRKCSSEDLLCLAETRERDSVSQDSGISQVSLGSRSATSSTAGSRTPVHRTPAGGSEPGATLAPLADDQWRVGERVAAVLSDETSSHECREGALHSIRQLVQHGSDQFWHKQLRVILRLLLDTVRSCSWSSSRQVALVTVGELAARPGFDQLLEPFAELLFLRVLAVCSESGGGGGGGGVTDGGGGGCARAAEQCASLLSRHLAPGTVLRVLLPLSQTAEVSACQAALKALTQLVTSPARVDQLAEWLPQLMPALLRAYDHSESRVRKAAVFCIVAIHQRLGADALERHLAVLSATKLKLLTLYIRRAQQGASGSGAGTSLLATPTSKPTTPK